MLRAARDEGKVDVAATCLLAFAGLREPTVEQHTGARLLAFALSDLHVLARGKVLKE